MPFAAYIALRHEITAQLSYTQKNEDYDVFEPADYVDNPVALARIKAGLTQEELAELMAVTQAYISKIENPENVSVTKYAAYL